MLTVPDWRSLASISASRCSWDLLRAWSLAARSWTGVAFPMMTGLPPVGSRGFLLAATGEEVSDSHVGSRYEAGLKAPSPVTEALKNCLEEDVSMLLEGVV